MISAAQLIAVGCNPRKAGIWSAPITDAMERFEISSVEQRAGFVAQAMHESDHFEHMEENLRYSNPARIAEIFRSGFDLNRDRRITADEIEFARGYVMQPEKLANRAYAGRNGNGDEASGDGWAYRGSGPYQLTGRANFSAFSAAVGIDYVKQPALVRTDPVAGSLAAAWYWTSTGCNDLISVSFDATTKRINGPAMLGAVERRAFFASALQVLS